MDNMIKVEQWNGSDIRWIEIGGEWMAVGNDVAKALGYTNSRKALGDHVDKEDKNTVTFRDGTSGNPTRTVITEFGIYSLIFSSQLPEAKQFKRWVFGVIKELRESEDLKAFEAMKMLDTKHQKNSMSNLKRGLKEVSKVDYIKANTIADKRVSNDFGFDKMVKKGDMSPAMLAARQPILDGVVDLMSVKDKLGLDLSVSKTVYAKAN
ncbi:Bro-N domain-containing protein [Lacticaseibacillus parakribbianus]|uniref:BRO-N domain-containing protein n=1 Tax=Lacticaseibacillus parakribbianus TaxID=2970927 RepID=UPI0021CAFD1D|nr:BRO family protein [Lacticaseibacillus parakribbianus]